MRASSLAVPVPFGSIAPQQLGPNGTGALSELAVAFGGLLLLLLCEAVARHAALAAGRARFFFRPFVSGTLFVGDPTALAGDLTLLLSVHRGKSAIRYCHRTLLHVLCAQLPRGPCG